MAEFKKKNRTGQPWLHINHILRKILIVKMGEDQYLEGEGWGN